MNQLLPSLPRIGSRPMTSLLAIPARFTPLRCQALLVEPVLQHVFAESIEDGELDFLQRDMVEIAITDIGLHWFLTLVDGRIRLVSRGRSAVTVAGGLPEFLLLASRQEDPDTLFFERRLTVEGDTEVGLLIKNLLDSIELDALPSPLRRAVDLSASWVQ